MRNTLLIILALTWSASDPCAQRDGARSGGRGGDDGSIRLEHFDFQRVEFPAPSLERVWGEFGIYLPKGYDDPENAGRRHPWAIWLHGMNGDYRRFHTGGAPVLDRLRGEGKIPPMVLVAATAARRTLYFNGESSGDYEDLILRDLVHAVEKDFRVSRARGERAIMGVSIGGFGAMRFALKHPDAFGAVATHSSAVFPADPADLPASLQRQAGFMTRSMGLDRVLGDPIDPDVWAAEIPTAMITRMAPGDLKGLRIYFDAGTEDRYGFAEPNVQFHEALQARGIEHTFRLIEGGGHSWGSGFTQNALVDSLQFVGRGFTDAAGGRGSGGRGRDPIAPGPGS